MEKAILSLAVAAVSPIIGKLIEKLSASYLGGDVTFEEIKKLHTIILPQIHIAIKATEEIPIDTLKPWLMDLKAAAFEAEDLLDLYEYKVIENKLVNLILLTSQGKRNSEAKFTILPRRRTPNLDIQVQALVQIIQEGMIRMLILLDCLGDVEKHLERERW